MKTAKMYEKKQEQFDMAVISDNVDLANAMYQE